ncbi:MAG: IS110 family transposase [bacterium]
MSDVILGIDIAKKKFDAALLVREKIKHKVFPNTNKGFQTLAAWLNRQGVERVHACMEPTNIYAEALASYLYDAGHRVSLVNPVRIKGYAQSELSRNKTDKKDATVIARFCRAQQPAPWIPDPPEKRELQALVRRLDALAAMRQQEKNRLEVASFQAVNSIHKLITFLDEEIEQIKSSIREHIDRHPEFKAKQELLETIPGIGETTIAIILAEFSSVELFGKARQMAAFIGVVPKHHCSGSSINKKARMSKTGRANLRKALYMPAIVAKNHNPVIAAFCKRLEKVGKPKMAIIGAAMRKLVHIIFGVLKNKKPFDSDFAVIHA